MVERRASLSSRPASVESRLLHVLSRLHRALPRLAQRDALYAEICELLITVGAYRGAWIGVADARGAIWPVAWSGAAGVDTERIIEQGVRAPATADCLRSRAPVATEGALTLPLGQHRAVLTVHHGTSQGSATEVQMLENIASTVGLACAALEAQQARIDSERALRLQRSAAIAQAERCPHGVALLDAEGRFVQASPQALDLLGLSLDALRARRVVWGWTVYDEPSLTVPHAALITLDLEVARAPRWIGREDGSVVAVLVTSSRVEGGWLLWLEERDGLEAHVLTALEAFERADTGMLLLDDHGRLLRANEAFLSFVGYTRDELAMLGGAEITHPADWLMEQTYLDGLRTGQRDGFFTEKRYLRRDGVTVWGHVVVCRIPRSGGGTAVLALVIDITRRREFERALDTSIAPRGESPLASPEGEARLRSMLDAVVDGTWTLDASGVVLGASAAGAEMLGEKEERLVGSSIFQYIPMLSLVEVDRAGGARPLREATLRHSSGREMPIEYAVASTRVEGGAVYSLVARDLSAQKRAEMALIDSEERYRVLFATSPDGIIKTHLDSMTIRWANPAACRLLGYSVAELTGISLWRIHPEAAVKLMQAALVDRGPDRGEPLAELACVRKDGSTVFADVKVAALVTHGTRSMLGLYRDVTATRAMMAELRTLNRAIEHSPVSVVVTDVRGVIEYVNPRTVQVTGYSAEEMIGARPSVLKSGIHDEAFYDDMWRCITGGREWHGELCNRRKNGELFWESGSIAPVRNSEGTVTHFVAIKLDITERKRINHELVKAKEAAEAANHAKSTFLANMSHEIRTPLNAILGFSQLLIAQPGHSPDNRRGLEAINRSGEHLLALINDVLEMSKIEAGRTSVHVVDFDLHRMLDDLEVMFRVRTDARSLELVRVIDTSVPRRVRLDQGKLRQILINLVGNAVKFTERGSITLRVRVESQILVIEVEDTGCGIEAHDLTRLFGYFEQTAQGHASGTGTGLGLAISREFCRLMGGTVDVRSEFGRGSTFSVRLPFEASSDLLRSEPPASITSSPTNCDLRVLVVDDLEDNRCVLIDMLGKMNATVAEASDGQEALERFETFAPHLVLLDMRMPVMDGYETARRLRALPGGHDVRILAVSASAFEEDRQPMLEAGADDCLPKPVRFADLMKTIGRLCHCEVAVEFGLAPSQSAAPSFGRICDLDADMRAEVLDAVVRADSERLRELIDALAATHEEAARSVEWLVDRYDYDRLLKLLE